MIVKANENTQSGRQEYRLRLSRDATSVSEIKAITPRDDGT